MMKNSPLTPHITKNILSVLIVCAMAALTSCNKTPISATQVATPSNQPPVVLNWVRLNALNDTITVLEEFNHVIYAASNNNKLYTSANEGTTWTTLRVGTPDVAISAIRVFNNQIYIGTQNNGIFSSNDGGTTWSNYVNGFQDYNIYGQLVGYPVSSFAVKDNVLYAGTRGNGVHTLNQAAGQWSAFNNNLPQIITSYEVFKLLSSNNTLVAAAGVNATFYYYNFNTGQWVYTALPHIQTYINKMIVDNGTLYAVTSERKIIRSSNNGINWDYDSVDLHDAALTYNYKELYSGTAKNYVFTVGFGGSGENGTTIQQRDKNAPIGTSWSSGQQFLGEIHANALLELNGKLFLGTNEGLYVKSI